MFLEKGQKLIIVALLWLLILFIPLLTSVALALRHVYCPVDRVQLGQGYVTVTNQIIIAVFHCRSILK